MAGEPDIKEKLKKGHTANGKKFKMHLDGYDQRKLLAGTGSSQRNEILYFDDSGSLNAVRVRDWKAHFSICDNWYEGGPTKLQNFPKIVNLRAAAGPRSSLLHVAISSSSGTLPPPAC